MPQASRDESVRRDEAYERALTRVQNLIPLASSAVHVHFGPGALGLGLIVGAGALLGANGRVNVPERVWRKSCSAALAEDWDRVGGDIWVGVAGTWRNLGDYPQQERLFDADEFVGKSER